MTLRGTGLDVCSSLATEKVLTIVYRILDGVELHGKTEEYSVSQYRGGKNAKTVQADLES